MSSECAVTQGHTSPMWLIGATGVDGESVDISGAQWVATVEVDTAEPPISRPATVKTQDGLRFEVQLTPAETTTLKGRRMHRIRVTVTDGAGYVNGELIPLYVQ